MGKKAIFVTLDEGLHAQMKSAAPLRGLNLQQAYDAALRAWLAGAISSGSIDQIPTDVVKSSGIHILESEIKWVRLLTDILRSGHQVIGPLIQKTLEGFRLIVGKVDERGTPDAVTPAGAGNDGTFKAALDKKSEVERLAEEYGRIDSDRGATGDRASGGAARSPEKTGGGSGYHVKKKAG
jgi:hypothetical protein